MNPLEENDPLEKILREPAPYIADDGFTARVVGALPRRPRAWLRPAILLGVIAAGAVLGFWWMPWTDLLPSDPTALFAANSPALKAWLAFFAVIGALVWGLIAALRYDE